MSRRVVVTGMGALSPLGSDWATAKAQLLAKRNGVRPMPEWDAVDGLQTRLGAAVEGFSRPAHYSRKKVRTMGRVALLATRATELALADAGLSDSSILGDGRAGIAYGSTSGSPPAIEQYARQITVNRTLSGVTAAQYIQFMSHTVAANLAQFFGVRGRLIPTCSACTSSSQGIGYAYEAIKYGGQDVMIAGGAEELHLLCAAVFDIMYATSTRNSEPETSPRPFDRARDGLVVGEGAGTLILESLDHARARAAPIVAELVGWATNCDGLHVVNPSVDGMQAVMRAALADAQLDPARVAFVNAHGTATEVGDVAESRATYAVFQRPVPISSLKSYMGHTLGACGALEAWLGINMAREGWQAPNLNLDEVDPACAPLDYLTDVRELPVSYWMSNNFAFGGVNTSLIFGPPPV
ncbi:beta-ketoacyl-ACP synthase [Acanthopleuribacter pedis]|uniref:Beta-ketoacyl-ACP synthase n=1 Tax=Acanthopleuribacter pedis TaxID=442870 RepID=A0A8J7U5N9_9BACT|nr:beta-ketoacyl-ACP synthase [Acanthopleuribacter pedis]MBO1320653.1 beta-ketoacyl-ACP synthase [Acanthopleuribacter pedis]